MDPAGPPPGSIHYCELPAEYRRWKWWMLLALVGLYMLVYLRRVNFWQAVPAIKEDLRLSHIHIIRMIDALLLCGFAVGDFVYGPLEEAYDLRRGCC